MARPWGSFFPQTCSWFCTINELHSVFTDLHVDLLGYSSLQHLTAKRTGVLQERQVEQLTHVYPIFPIFGFCSPKGVMNTGGRQSFSSSDLPIFLFESFSLVFFFPLRFTLLHDVLWMLRPTSCSSYGPPSCCLDVILQDSRSFSGRPVERVFFRVPGCAADV